PIVVVADVAPGGLTKALAKIRTCVQFVEGCEERILALRHNPKVFAVPDVESLDRLGERNGRKSGRHRLQKFDLRSPAELDRADRDVRRVEEGCDVIHDPRRKEGLIHKTPRELADDDKAQMLRSLR